MDRGAAIALTIILAVVASSASADEYQLYKPQKATSGDIPVAGEGVLTKTIIIQRGDTLSKLSRKYNGRSSFFSQILLFNKIENPDLIFAGKTLRVPLSRKEAINGKKEEATRGPAKKKPATTEVNKTSAKMRTRHYTPVGGKAGKPLFNSGVSAYMNGRYDEAIEIFDRYLAVYPNSPDAPDAALYRAECYTKLSNH